MAFTLRPQRSGAALRRGLAAALIAASVAVAFAPSAAEAQSKYPKERVRITAADRKAAADARKAKMAEWKKSRAGGPAQPNGRGGGK